jgi:DNA-binding NarL/FixJ family response regulator
MCQQSTAVRILLADDHELVRQGLIQVLRQSHPDWEIIAEAANGAEAIALGESLKPDVAILDLSMPEATGLDVTTRLHSTVPGIKILILTVHMALPVLRRVRRAGASALLTKSEAPTQLVAAVERVLAGDPFFASPIASRPLIELDPGEYIPIQYLLSARELDVLRLLTRGLVNKEIATALGLGIRTVETHRASIMARLAADSLGELTRLAVRDGII